MEDDRKTRKKDNDGNFVLDKTETDNARSALTEFLVCLGTYCPENYMHTVLQESTSFQWVIDSIKTTYRFETRGLGFLVAGTLKIEFDEESGQSYQQGYQAIEESYCSSLLRKGDKWKGRMKH